MLRIRDYIRFEIVVAIVYSINIGCYGIIGAFIAGFNDAANNRTTDASILISLFLLIYLFLPYPLALNADKNKRKLEKYIHLVYIIFAPPLFLILSSLPYLYIIIFILFPFFFVLKNLYLGYRDRNKRISKLQLVEKNLEEYVGSLDKKSKSIKEYAITGAIAGIIAGINIGIIAGGIAGFFAGLFAGARVGVIGGAIAGLFAGVFASMGAGSVKYVSVGVITSVITSALTSSIIGASIGYIFH